MKVIFASPFFASIMLKRLIEIDNADQTLNAQRLLTMLASGNTSVINRSVSGIPEFFKGGIINVTAAGIEVQWQDGQVTSVPPADIGKMERYCTAYTNGKKIVFFAGALAAWTIEEIAGVIVHETMHIANGHHMRLGKRSLQGWNYATDYAINPYVEDEGYKLPEGGLIDRQRFPRGISAEEVYEELKKEAREQNKQKKKNPLKVGTVVKIKATGQKGIVTAIKADGTYQIGEFNEQPSIP